MNSQQKEEITTPVWMEALRISDHPDVHEALHNFSHDSTQDNAVGVVLAVRTEVLEQAAILCDNRIGWNYDAGSCAAMIRDLKVAPPAPSDTVPVPQNEAQAVAMAIVATAWLKEHAPHRLKQDQQ